MGMSEKVRVSFGDPENGWVRQSISCGDQVLRIVGSYTPSDSFRDLTTALLNLLVYEGEFVVTRNEEPAETDLQFARSGEIVRLEVLQFQDRHRNIDMGKSVFDVSGSYEEICHPFWRALRNLQSRFTIEDLDARWHRPFPSVEITKLTVELS